MNIREALLAEHSKQQTMRIVNYVGSDRGRFAELMEVFFAGPYRVTQRAAWPMSYCAERQPELIRPYLPKLLDLVERGNVHDAVRRNSMRLLQFVDIPPRLKGRIYSICLDLIADATQPVAVKAFSITTARRIAETEPALMSELRLVVGQQLAHSSIALCKRAREIM